ncbi:ATP-binding cassette domain-containing protein [Leucobacter weissii]|uniref:ATP-binding cassette domain-containing protein n=1 Tax=Leucobacter weissii TaxID=1983706 RepID=A0A939MNZ9_9MICO|nr:ATP-binding cassette domain-containing protein [Leucobacter weissii]MBO1902092.1 ATP-binding cassette domain-containing protein [Leucobacter weissii]
MTEGAGGLVVERITHAYREPGSRRSPRRERLRTVLNGVSLSVAPGTLTAILGPSGCGKSTLLRILAGLEQPASGTATVDGESLIGRPGGVAYHPQQDALLPWLSALDNATLGAETCGEDRAGARERARALLGRFGLDDVERAWPDELSGGMRQRVALLRSTLMPQSCLVLDEPLGALDALTRRQLQFWLLDITASDRRPTLLVTHDIEEALLLADRVLVLSPSPAEIVHVEDRPGPAARRREREDGADHVAARRVLAALETGTREGRA